MGFIDSDGIYRNPGEGFVDSDGIFRHPGEGFVDSDGIFRHPGEGFVDSDGIFRHPGEGFVDAGGYYRDPSDAYTGSSDSGGGSSGSSSSSGGGGGSIMLGLMFIGVLVAITIGLSPIWYFMSKNAIKKAKSRGEEPGEFASMVYRVSRIPGLLILVFYAVMFSLVIVNSILGIIGFAGKIPDLSELDWSSISFS